MKTLKRLTSRQFYALIWKDYVIHKRHYVWTLHEIIIPVLVCTLAILSNNHQGKPKLESERTFDADDYEKIYGDLNPQRHRLLVAPNSSFTRALVDQIDDGAVRIELCNTELELVDLIKQEIPVSLDQVKRLLPDESANVTIGGVVIKSDSSLAPFNALSSPTNHADSRGRLPAKSSRERQEEIARNKKNSYYYEVISKLDGKPMNIPLNFDLSIRAKDFRLGKEPFPKKYSLGPFLHSDHYISTFFMASQIMLSRAYISLLANYMNVTKQQGNNNSADAISNEAGGKFVIPTNDDIIGQRIPYPKFVAHKRLKESTLGTFVAGSQKQKPFVLTMDYCITVGFLVTAIFLAKRIVDERKSRVRDMLRLVGISDWTYYGSHMCNTMIIMSIQCVMITILFTGHHEAPAQNIDSTLMFTILMLYCISSIMFIMFLSTLFNSSTRAIIFTSLLWLGLPEVLDRIFKMNSGVIESNGFWIVDEYVHLMFCLIPNFGLRLMNRLLTECDIYGEFFDKKQLYGEYRAIWPNLMSVLPLYKTVTIGYIMLVILLSIPVYALLIYLVNSASSSSQIGLASLAASDGPSKSSKLANNLLFLIVKNLVKLILTLVISPFKLTYEKLFRSSKSAASKRDSSMNHNWSSANLNQSNPNVILMDNGNKHRQASNMTGYYNEAYTSSSLDNLAYTTSKDKDINHEPNSEFNRNKTAITVNQMELNSYPNNSKNVLNDSSFSCNSLKTNDKQSIVNSGCQSHNIDKTRIQQTSNIDHDELSNDPKYFETAPKILKLGVSIRNLCKTFFTSNPKMPRIDAVRNVSLDMYYSQILVLLGHNGAGKTTLIDIISGHNQMTSGSVHIDGYNIETHPAEARRGVGFCPQFDVLFERLTVEEHLYFYGIVKGARDGLKSEMEQLLIQSGLDVHRRKLSKALSGGYKRKLSLAIAMIADSKVLILDEPTSGMDPESRRKVWDFLQLIRHDRLILMTTHHMEEADALGDRIAVMSGGQVKCCGSALFLKRVFNAGYHLRISKSDTWNQLVFDELILSKYKLDSKLENITPHELIYKFDADETSKLLPDLFGDLENLKERIGIFGFGITVSTMDDVFMKIGVHFKDVEAQEMQSKFEMSLKTGSNNTETGSDAIPDAGGRVQVNNSQHRNKRHHLEGSKLFKQHMRALLMKRYQHASKSWFQLVWILCISLACVASTVILIDLIIFKEELTPEWDCDMTLEGAGYGRNTFGVYQFETPPSTTPIDDMEALRAAAFPDADQTTATTEAAATTTNVVASGQGSTSTTSAPNISRTASSTTTSGPPIGSSTASSSLGTTGASGGAQTRPRRRTRRQAEEEATAGNNSLIFLDDYWHPEAKKSGIRDEVLTYTDINTQMIDLLTGQFADFRERYVVGGERSGKRYIAWYNGEASHSFPISMNIMLNSILKQFTDLIKDNGHPLKRSRINLKHSAMAQINTLIAFLPHLGRLINLVFLPFSLAFITSYFVIFPTHERVTKSKHLQLMTGVTAKTFWLSHFIFDLILYSIYTTAALTIYFVWDRVINDRKIFFPNFEHSLALIGLVVLFIMGALPQAYIFSSIAKKPTSAFSSFCVLTVLTGTSTLMLVSLYELKYESTASIAFKATFVVFLWLVRLLPSVSLLVGLQKLFALNTTRSICINISPEVLELLCRYISSPLVDEELRVLKPERCCRQVCQDECYDQWPFFWTGWFGVNVELAMLVVDACLYWFILVIIESRAIRERLWSLARAYSPIKATFSLLTKARTYVWQVPQFGASQTTNKDVLQEQRRIRQIVDASETRDYSMVVSDLTKVYSTNQFKAVDQLSFLVDKHEFFGLLGVNGAGKSTTFKMLTGELRPTFGNSWIGGTDLRGTRRQYLKHIGYCPQQDALIDHLTGAEMLALFARLRGIPESEIEVTVEETLDKLGLKRIGHNNCGNYSGGNKRRLSVGMALIGAPEVIFLDEPTSGVDPRSRRRLWSTLIEFQQQTRSAVVMTSHSMNECESLCDRVAIMVGGQFKVLGSIQYLRTKLSQGFSLILKLKPNNLNQLQDLTKSSERIDDYMKKAFASNDIQLKDLHQTIIQYHIQPSAELTWHKMLVLLEKAKEELDLEDYQVTSDASLESIFLSLAKQNDNEKRQVPNKTNDQTKLLSRMFTSVASLFGSDQ